VAEKPNVRNVVRREDGTWAVNNPDASRASAVFDVQAEAIRRGHQILHRAGGGELRIHGVNGQIRDARTVPPGNDPCPPKDKDYSSGGSGARVRAPLLMCVTTLSAAIRDSVKAPASGHQ
jgi:hypothetical protein